MDAFDGGNTRVIEGETGLRLKGSLPGRRVLRRLTGCVAAGLIAAVGPAQAAPSLSVDEPGSPGMEAAVTGLDPEQLTCFVGGVDDGAFMDAASLADRFRGGTSYRLYNLSGAHGQALAPGPPVNEGSEGECADLWRHEMALDPRSPRGFFAGLHTRPGTDPLPRVLEVLDAPLPEHETLLRDFLARRNVADPVVDIAQTVRTDLEGDGLDDYILNAVHDHPDKARKGDYSVVLVLKGVGEGTRTYIIQDEITLEDSPYPSTLWVNRIVAVVDVDGDGVMEILMNGAYLYGGGWDLIRFEQGGFEHILFCGCDG